MICCSDPPPTVSAGGFEQRMCQVSCGLDDSDEMMLSETSSMVASLDSWTMGSPMEWWQALEKKNILCDLCATLSLHWPTMVRTKRLIWKQCFLISLFFLGGDPLACTIPCKWNNDTFSVVLEIQSESSKATSDAEPCSLRDLLHELEENNIIDVSLHSHTVERPGPSEETTSGS